MRRGKYGRNSQCKVCRASLEKFRRSENKMSYQILMYRTTEHEYNKCLDIIQGLSTEYNNLIQQNYHDNSFQYQLAHQHEDIIRNLDNLKGLTIKRHIESQTTSDNLFWLSNIPYTNREYIKCIILINICRIFGNPVNRDNVELVFYKPLPIKTLSGTSNAW